MPHHFEHDNIQNSFEVTLTDSNLQNLGTDIAELALDSVLNEGLLKEIPVVGTIVNLSKIGTNIHDRLFIKKILSFLSALKDVSLNERKKMIESIDNSKKYRVRVGEKLLYIIDSSEDYEISELVGLLFKAYLEGKITYDDFIKTASVLNRLNKSDFDWFVKERKNFNFYLDEVGDLVSSGLFELYYEPVEVSVADQDDYKALSAGSFANRYKTRVDGGGVGASPSRAGEVILEVFCPSYKKKEVIKI